MEGNCPLGCAQQAGMSHGEHQACLEPGALRLPCCHLLRLSCIRWAVMPTLCPTAVQVASSTASHDWALMRNYVDLSYRCSKGSIVCFACRPLSLADVQQRIVR